MIRNWSAVCLIIVSFFRIGVSEGVPRIGIVGAGVGGTSAAYFLRELFGDSAQIDVFERKVVGGRLAVINIDDHYYNVGGSIIHPQNMYMVNFTNMLGLGMNTDSDSDTFGLFNGDEMLFSTSDWSVISLMKLVWRYGLDIINIRNWVQEKVLKPMQKLYQIQADGHAFSTVEDLLNSMDETLVSWTKKSIKTLLKEEGFSDKFIEEIVMGAMRINYGQTTDVHGLVGAVSMAGIEPGLWNVIGGNQKVPQGLLEKSKANLIHGVVRTVTLLSDDTPMYTIHYTIPSDQEKLEIKEYDIVILATPIYKGIANIEFSNFQKEIEPIDYDFHLTVATFVEGQPNATFFGYDDVNDLPQDIITINDKLFFNSLSKQNPVEPCKEELKNDKTVYKLFSNRVPTKDEINQICPKQNDLRMINWMAYPNYTSSINLPSFILNERLYHISGIEMAASAIEMSIVSAKNVALLASYHWNGQYDKIDELSAELERESRMEKTEL
ncbi:hypothetical protein CHS0354_008196 [Potamilus streckersoni]|uniref:Prenylcysteine lyase domain-containing protein n=1 Tax=Potamilus streckersoni TaxID=2493646 RepID=A0AAE0VKG4_9BIVA|nr:hypothetical protein CHS0354_008196 [Potamilus streckersoni]